MTEQLAARLKGLGDAFVTCGQAMRNLAAIQMAYAALRSYALARKESAIERIKEQPFY